MYSMRALLAVLTALPASALQAHQFQQGMRVWDKFEAPTGAVSWMRKDFAYCRDDFYTPDFTYVSTDECKASCAASSSCYGVSVGTYTVRGVKRPNICFQCTSPYIVDVTNTSSISLGAENDSPWSTTSGYFTSYVKATPDPNWIVKDWSKCNGNEANDWGKRATKSVAECKADCEASPDCYAIVVGDYTTTRHVCMLCTDPKAADVSASGAAVWDPVWDISGWATALIKSKNEKSEKIGLDGWERKDWAYCYTGVDFGGRTQETLEECKASCSATPDCYAIVIGTRQGKPRECFQCKDPMNGDASSSDSYWVKSGWGTAYIKAETTIAPTPVPPTPVPPTTAPTPAATPAPVPAATPAPTKGSDIPQCTNCGNRPMECWETCGKTKGYCSACDSLSGRRGACCFKGGPSDPPAPPEDQDPDECSAVDQDQFLYSGYHMCVLTNR